MSAPAKDLSLHDRYMELVASGKIERDHAQEEVARRLDELRRQLGDYRLASKSSALGWLFGARQKTSPPKGVYIWGAVGRGKTMLMDMFFEDADFEPKKRVHFHAFMGDVHKRIYAWRQRKKAGEAKGDDPIAPVADEIAAQTALLCFDEFAVTDIADAMILGRLFQALFARGLTVVATSNVEPSELYKDGLNRSLFLPFIGLIRERMDVVKLDARADFRLEKLGGAPVYYVPADAAAYRALSRAFLVLTGEIAGRPMRLPLLGREIHIPQAAGHVARFDYADLCVQPLGAADFLAIADNFHTVIVDRIPLLDADKRNEPKRFITLIDALYDRKVKLLASAAAEPVGLYLGTQGREAFEFARTASRLIEMRSRDYLALPHGLSGLTSGDITGLVET